MAEDIDHEAFEDLVENLMWVTPEKLLRAVGKGIIVRQTAQYGYSKTKSGLIIPGSKTFEKKYNLGEVLKIGEEVPTDRVDVGDIVIFQRASAFRLPNG